MKQNEIILLVGKSGSGKSTIANELTKQYGLKQLESYTTRSKRKNNEKGHTFITKEEYKNFNKKDICAYTFFNNNHYFATKQQVEDSDIYIIDVDGIKYFKEKYKGNKKIITICIKIDTDSRKKRMANRNEKMEDRLKADNVKFKDLDDINFDLTLYNKNGMLQDTVFKIIEYIQNERK